MEQNTVEDVYVTVHTLAHHDAKYIATFSFTLVSLTPLPDPGDCSLSWMKKNIT